jgi:hypothetical protein
MSPAVEPLADGLCARPASSGSCRRMRKWARWLRPPQSLSVASLPPYPSNSLSLTGNSTAKALEMFLAMLVEESNKVTASRGSKKVEAYHL